MKQRGTLVRLHAHFADVIHGQYRSFQTSLPWQRSRCGRAPSIHVGLRTLREPGWRWTLKITVCFEIFDSNLFSKLHPDQESIVFWTLLEHDSVIENARGITVMWEIITTSTPATIFPLGFILDALSKNSYHTCSSEEALMMLTSAISSRRSSKSFEFPKIGWSAKKLAIAWRLIAFCGMNCIIYCVSNMVHFASLQFREDGLIMSNRKGLTLKMTWMRCSMR